MLRFRLFFVWPIKKNAFLLIFFSKIQNSTSCWQLFWLLQNLCTNYYVIMESRGSCFCFKISTDIWKMWVLRIIFSFSSCNELIIENLTSSNFFKQHYVILKVRALNVYFQKVCVNWKCLYCTEKSQNSSCGHHPLKVIHSFALLTSPYSVHIRSHCFYFSAPPKSKITQTTLRLSVHRIKARTIIC